MDPISVLASLSGLVIAIQELVSAIYKYGKGVKGAKKEINQLCSELFALKAALEHMRLNLNDTIDIVDEEKPNATFSSSLVESKEFSNMLDTTDTFVKDLSKSFNKGPGRLDAVMTSWAWPLKKEDVKNELQRLERLKSYFILANTTDNLELCKQIYMEVYSIAQAVAGQQQQQYKKAGEKLRKSVIQWLAPYNPTTLFRAARASKQSGTGRWFLDGPFHEWLSGKSSEQVLLLQGKSGTGKTTLMAAAFDEAEVLVSEGGHRATTYFFCSFTDLSSQDPVSLFGSILVQLCSLEPALWPAVDDHFSKEEGRSPSNPVQLSLAEVEILLEQACKALPEVLIFIDAVNESKHPTLILSTFWKLTRRVPGMRIVISSTEELFPSDFESPMPSVLTITVTPDKVDEDIKDYIDSWLSHDRRLRSLPSRLKRDIRSKLLSESDGMFRWVECQLKSLVVLKTPADIKAALDAVPATLEQTYCNILFRIPKGDREIAKKAFLWLVYSIRVLDFAELCEAVVVDERRAGVDENARLLQPEDLLHVCSSLISFDSKRKTIALAHSSVPAYLTSKQLKRSEAGEFWIDPDSADVMLTCKCISYLCSSELASGYCDTMVEFNRRWDDLPLLDYAVHGWQTHARFLEEGDIDRFTRDLLFHFFETAQRPRGGNFGAWVQAFLPFAHMKIENSTPFYYAARFGLTPIVKMVLAVQGTRDLETLGGRRGSTPLHAASAFGRVEVVRTLLEAGANAREVNEKGESGLQWAVLYGSKSIVKMLLDAGADPNFRNFEGHTPLYYAVCDGDERCATILIQAGADADNVDGKGMSAFTLRENRHSLDWTKSLKNNAKSNSTSGLNGAPEESTDTVMSLDVC